MFKMCSPHRPLPLPHPLLQIWWEWEPKYRDAHPEAIAELKAAAADRFDTFIAIQFLFDHFWKAVKVSLENGVKTRVFSQSGSRHLLPLRPPAPASGVAGVPQAHTGRLGSAASQLRAVYLPCVLLLQRWVWFVFSKGRIGEIAPAENS